MIINTDTEQQDSSVLIVLLERPSLWMDTKQTHRDVIDVCMHTHTHACMHALTHTQTHTHTLRIGSNDLLSDNYCGLTLS